MKKITDFVTSANKRQVESSPTKEISKSLKKTRLATPSPKKKGIFN